MVLTALIKAYQGTVKIVSWIIIPTPLLEIASLFRCGHHGIVSRALYTTWNAHKHCAAIHLAHSIETSVSVLLPPNQSLRTLWPRKLDAPIWHVNDMPYCKLINMECSLLAFCRQFGTPITSSNLYDQSRLFCCTDFSRIHFSSRFVTTTWPLVLGW